MSLRKLQSFDTLSGAVGTALGPQTEAIPDAVEYVPAVQSVHTPAVLAPVQEAVATA